MAEKFSAVTLAMGNGINEIVNSIAADYGDDAEPQTLSSKDPLGVQQRMSDSNVRLVVKSNESQTSSGSAVGSAVGASSSVTSGNPNKFVKSAEGTLVKADSYSSTTAASTASASTKPAAGASAASPTETLSAITPPPPPPLPLPSDPLSGALTMTEGDHTSAPPPPHSPILTGKGTGYKNMPATAIKPTEDRDPLVGAAGADGAGTGSPSVSGYHMRSKILKSGWFPASATKKDQKSKSKRDNRSSGGVDLHVLHSSLKAIEGQHSDQESSGAEDGEMKSLRVAPKESSLSGVQKNAIGDRLLDLADLLVHPAYKNMPATLVSGRELEYEAEMRRDAVKKLRAMADVLAGLISIDAYDTKFAAPTATQPGPASPVRQQVAASSTVQAPPTVGSPLPVVKERKELDGPDTPELDAADRDEGARINRDNMQEDSSAEEEEE